jgi:hypothetical protein
LVRETFSHSGGGPRSTKPGRWPGLVRQGGGRNHYLLHLSPHDTTGTTHTTNTTRSITTAAHTNTCCDNIINRTDKTYSEGTAAIPLKIPVPSTNQGDLDTEVTITGLYTITWQTTFTGQVPLT